MKSFQFASVVALTVILGLFGGTLLAAAQDCVPGGNTGCGDIAYYTGVPNCMDDLFTSGTLGCTANDVRVSGVADVGTSTGNGCIDGPDGKLDECDITFKLVCDKGATNVGTDCSEDPYICYNGAGPNPTLCGDRCAYDGDTTTFAATFIVLLSAQERYDIGLYFASDGDPNGDGALTGQCAVGTLPEAGSFDRPDGSTGNFVDLDSTCTGKGCPQPQDLCGDINNANNPIFYDLAAKNKFITVTCIGNANNKLNLPNCTSWRQSGANEVCTSPLKAYPGAPSKCNCQPQFEVPINVPLAKLQVVKTAAPTSLNEPGGDVTYTVTVTNTGIDPSNYVILNNPGGLMDDIYGDITKKAPANPYIKDTNCSLPLQLSGNGGTYSCSFTVNIVANAVDYPEGITDVVTAAGISKLGKPISGSDDATVTIVDVKPAIDVTKDADPTSVIEPGADVKFTVTVYNKSTASTDPLMITSLTDDKYAAPCVDAKGNSLIGQTIPVGGSLTCTFTALVAGNMGEDAKVDEMTVYGKDDEGNEVFDSDTASVSITDSPAKIELIKTASPTEVNEPGENVTFTLKVNNLSPVDPLTITSLTDQRPYPSGTPANIGSVCLDAAGKSLIGQTIPGGGSNSLTCTFTIPVKGDANYVEKDLAKVEAKDNDVPPNTVSDDADAMVTIKDVPPAANLTKTVTGMIVRYKVTVSNLSSAETLTLDKLEDDQFGDITTIHDNVRDTNCELVAIAAGSSYTCYFDGAVAKSPHKDKVTGYVSDNEGTTITPSDCAEVTFGDPASCN